MGDGRGGSLKLSYLSTEAVQYSIVGTSIWVLYELLSLGGERAYLYTKIFAIFSIPDSTRTSVIFNLAMSASVSAAAAPDNIWDAAIALDQQRRMGIETGGLGWDAETSLVVVGSAGAGKSTLVYRFLDRQEAAKPTLALEYTYARRKNQDNTAVSAKTNLRINYEFVID